MGQTDQLATRLGRARHNQGRYNDKLAEDVKHMEIIKRANEEGNEGRQVEQINQ